MQCLLYMLIYEDATRFKSASCEHLVHLHVLEVPEVYLLKEIPMRSFFSYCLAHSIIFASVLDLLRF